MSALPVHSPPPTITTIAMMQRNAHLYPPAESSSVASSTLSTVSTRSSTLIDTVYAAATSSKATRVTGLANLSFHCSPRSSSSSTDNSIDGYPHSARLCESHSLSSSSSCGSGNGASNGADEFDSSSYDLFSRTAHMGILDPSYQLFVSQHGHGSLVYKLRSGVAVIAGDPMCAPDDVQALIDEFRWSPSACHQQHKKIRRRRRPLRIVYVGASAAFAERARRQGCATMHFGRERVLNPLTSPLLRNKAGKRTISQCRQLLDPTRGGISVGVYAPGGARRNSPSSRSSSSSSSSSSDSCGSYYDAALEADLQAVYDGWRAERDASRRAGAQAFITQYDLFSRPDITMFLYTRDRQGRPNGVAGLRYLGANHGFQLDPCVAAVGAPRGITDLLVVAALQLLRTSGISYLSLGFEPYEELRIGDGNGHNDQGLLARLTRDGYRRVMGAISAAGKRTHNDRLRPDDAQESGLYIVMGPGGLLQLRETSAIIRAANMDVASLFWRRRVGGRGEEVDEKKKEKKRRFFRQ